MDTQSIEQMIKSGLPDATVSVQSDDGVHFEAVVTSASLSGKSPIQRHRMVYATLGNFMGNEIHALSLRTMLPQEEAAS